MVVLVWDGSIGLPEIERRLRRAGHRNRSLNDVAAEIVPLFDLRYYVERIDQNFEASEAELVRDIL